MKQNKAKPKWGFLIAAAVLILLLSAGFIIFKEKTAVRSPDDYRESFSNVRIDVNEDQTIEITPQNGEQTKRGIIFYTGARIQPTAYIPLFSRIAADGISCFLPDFPLLIAPLNANAAEKIILEHPEITEWILSGHSMGGVAASGFAIDHPEKIQALILLASYANRDLNGADFPILSVYGDLDGVLNIKNYEKSKAYYSENFEEQIISGGNHAGFGDYGIQPGDHEASVTAEEQQTQTAENILDWLKRNSL